jgi:hypothetical protein
VSETRGRARGHGRALLHTLPKAQVSPGLLQNTLARLDAEPRAGPTTPPLPPADDAAAAPLHGAVRAHRLEEADARRVLHRSAGGGRGRAGATASLRARREDTAGCPELELLLSGGAVDDRDGGLYERGDVAYNDENDVHSVTIEPDEPCIALGVHEARLQPRGLWSRLVFGYLGW